MANARLLARSAFRARVALCRERLSGAGFAQLGRVSSWAVALLFGGLAVAARLGEPLGLDARGLVAQAATYSLWLAGLPIALAAADDRARLDREDGIAALVASRGGSSAGLAIARLVAAMTTIARALAIPTLAVALAALGTWTPGEGLGRLARGLLCAALFALSGGVVLGSAASLCERALFRRGRSLLLALVLVPWILADLVGRPGLSIPGALDALVSLTLGVGRGG